MRSLLLLAVTLALPGCLLFFDDGGKRQCNVVTDQPPTKGGADIAPQPLRNPDNLTCQSFGGNTCNPECGPCPPATEGAADLAPIPTWGVCGSACDSLDQTACAASPECRVVRDAACAVKGNCATDFVGCFPIDNAPDPSIVCNRATSGWDCSRNAACTALHRAETPCQAAVDGFCPSEFAMCVAEGQSPGKCHAEALCDIVAPSCPTNTTAGVANGCYTGVCIPNDLCEP